MNIVFKNMDSAPLDETRVLLECSGYHGGTYYVEGWYAKWSEADAKPRWMEWTGSKRVKSTAHLTPLRWAKIHD